VTLRYLKHRRVILNANYSVKNGTLHKILIFLAPKWPPLSLVPFKGPKKSRAPQKVSILCWDHLESLNRPQLVIWQGWFDKTTPNLQRKYINSYYALVTYILHFLNLCLFSHCICFCRQQYLPGEKFSFPPAFYFFARIMTTPPPLHTKTNVFDRGPRANSKWRVW